MSNRNIIRAWKDLGYRSTLTATELAALPAHPAGAVEISGEESGKLAGGMQFMRPTDICSCMCTDGCPWGLGQAGLQLAA